jgi:hypothetical protein
MFAALLYLQFHSVKNRLGMRLRRLKKPKYLAGAIVGGLYFYFYFLRWVFLGGRGVRGLGATSTESLVLYESMGALILFVIVFLSWLVPRERAALAFSEAEVAFLFPAPISRRGLVHYKLLRSQVAILIITLFLTLISGRATAGGSAWIRIAGWWLILSTLNLHFLGASFARTLLLERGISNWQRRTVVLALVGATVLWGRQTISMPRLEDFDRLRDFVSYAKQMVDSGPAPYLLYPFRLVVRPYLAADARSFLLALGPVLALLGLHYWWVIRCNVAFEEASVELSRKIADRIAAARAGRWAAGQKATKPKRAPFELHPTGLPAIALLWKNLIAAGQFFTMRIWLLLLWIGVVGSASMGSLASESGLLPALGFLSLMLIAMALLVGPQLVRQDFRQDLVNADILKMYPLQGWQVALGELLAPAAILTAIQWCLLVLAVGFCSHISSETAVPLVMRLAIGAAAAVVFPMLNLISLLIPNLAVLLFPSWFQSGKESPQGIEATGQRLIFVLGQLLVFCLAIIPAGLSFAAVFFVVNLVTGWVAAVLPAALAAALILGIEAWLGLRFLGRLFERLDLSSESAS